MRPIANQKKITIQKEVVEKESGKNRPYMIAYVNTIEKAAQELKNSAFKVYIYLLTNQNQFYFGLSPQDISNRYGISIDAARDGIKTLIQKGYLSAVNDSETEYIFYDSPDRIPVELAEEIEMSSEKRMFHTKNGEEIELTYNQILEQYGEKAKEIWERGNKQ